MSRGASGRIVLEVEPELKNRLHAQVAFEGRSLKDWFVEQALAYLAVENNSPQRRPEAKPNGIKDKSHDKDDKRPQGKAQGQ